MNTNNALLGLTESQKQAASCTGGPVLVVAGPGSGKTKTLVARLAFLIESQLAQPEELLAVTFTRKAAAELRTRLLAQLGPAGARITVGTFHRVALLLRPLPKGSLLVDEAERRTLGRACLAASSEPLPKGLSPVALADKLVETISRLKGQRCDWKEALANSNAPIWLKQAAQMYQQWQRDLGLLDLDDLLIAATLAVRSGGAARHFRYVQVDEYQDINGVQRELLGALCAAGATVFAIGDPDQAIYAFRGAEVAHFAAFVSDFAGARRFFLGENFRATANLVSAASALIGHNLDRPTPPGPLARAVREVGQPIFCKPARSGMCEAIEVARAIEQLVGGTSLSSHDQGRAAGWAAGCYGFSDIAVLTRTTARADQIAEALQREGVPILRPRRQKQVAAEVEAVCSSFADAPDASPFLRLKKFIELRRAARQQMVETPCAELEHESDEWDERLQRVAVLTLHGSKGLEFPVVFLCGCEAELMPGFCASRQDEAAVAEERRLFYVGLTRAKDLLCLSYVENRPPSPFLDELPAEWVATFSAPRRRPKKPQLKLF